VMAEVFNPAVLVGNKPNMRGRVALDTAEKVEQFFSELGYRCFAIGEMGLLRVRDLRSIPDGGANYVFSRADPPWSYAPYAEREAIRMLSARA
jgi:hypothetical protein